MPPFLWLIFFFWLGTFFGVFIMALCNIASDADRHTERKDSEE